MGKKKHPELVVQHSTFICCHEMSIVSEWYCKSPNLSILAKPKSMHIPWNSFSIFTEAKPLGRNLWHLFYCSTMILNALTFVTLNALEHLKKIWSKPVLLNGSNRRTVLTIVEQDKFLTKICSLHSNKNTASLEKYGSICQERGITRIYIQQKIFSV